MIEKKLIPVKRWNQHHTIPTQGAVNTMVLNRNENGLALHIVRLNNRLYLIEDEFFEWLLSHRECPLQKNTGEKKCNL